MLTEKGYEPLGNAKAAKQSLSLMQQLVQNVDAAVASIMAVGRAMTADDGQADILDFLRNPVFG